MKNKIISLWYFLEKDLFSNTDKYSNDASDSHRYSIDSFQASEENEVRCSGSNFFSTLILYLKISFYTNDDQIKDHNERILFIQPFINKTARLKHIIPK